MSTEDLFGLFDLIHSTLVQFSQHWSYSIHFDLIQSILSTLVLFGSFCLLWFYSIHSIHFSSIWSNLFTSVLFCPFGPIQFIWIILFHFDLFLYTYIMGKDMFRLKEHNLNPNLLKNI